MARVFALLAIGVPVFIVVAVRIYGYATGANGLMFVIELTGTFFVLFFFFAFGAAAVVAAVVEANPPGAPRGAWWDVTRRIGLGLLGLICSFYGFRSLLTIIEEPSLIGFLSVSVLLFPLGLGSLLVLWKDVCPPEAGPESDQP